jgi:hypothetical protein
MRREIPTVDTDGFPAFSFTEDMKARARAFLEHDEMPPENAVPAPLPATDISAARIKEACKLHVKFVSAAKKCARIAFELGNILWDIRGRLQAEVSWPEFVRDNFPFTPQAANGYLRVYENFRDNPGLLEEQSVSGALKSLSSPRSEKQGPVEYGKAGRQPELPWETIFAKPPVSGAALRNYRFERPDNHSVYLIRRGLDYPVKVVNLLTDDPPDALRFSYESMTKTIQSALELYYQEVEKQEKPGGVT